jgi:hypothetical protein
MDTTPSPRPLPYLVRYLATFAFGFGGTLFAWSFVPDITLELPRDAIVCAIYWFAAAFWIARRDDAPAGAATNAPS